MPIAVDSIKVSRVTVTTFESSVARSLTRIPAKAHFDTLPLSVQAFFQESIPSATTGSTSVQKFRQAFLEA